MELVKELKVVGEMRHQFSEHCATGNKANVIAAVKERLQTLAHWDSMQQRDVNLHEEFKAVFKPIPHVDDLPTNVYAEIRVNDSSKLSSTHTYACPQVRSGLEDLVGSAPTEWENPAI